MMKFRKQVSLVLAVMLVLSCFALPTFAADEHEHGDVCNHDAVVVEGFEIGGVVSMDGSCSHNQTNKQLVSYSYSTYECPVIIGLCTVTRDVKVYLIVCYSCGATVERIEEYTYTHSFNHY